MGVGKKIAAAHAESRRGTQILPATIVSVDGAAYTATVNVLGGVVTAQFFGAQPLPGRPAFVLLTDDGIALVLGTPAGPSLGTIAAPAADNRVAVTGDDDVTYSLYYSSQYEPVVGDGVLIGWEGGGHVIMPISGQTAPPAAPNLPPAPVSGEEQTATFHPSDSASWYGGRWNTTDVVFGESYPVGAWFYGGQMNDTIPDTATILSVAIYVEITSAYGSSSAQFGTHGESSRPGGTFPLLNLTDIGAAPAGFAGQIALPTSFGDAFKSGSQLGIGTAGSGFRVFRGVTGGSPQGAVTIRWRE